jgi:hypothetical protein
VQTDDAAERFAKAGLIGLRVLDRTEGRGRRFGGEADARWQGFRGHLHDGDRIELLLRDAAVRFHSAFSPAKAFLLPAVAEDDPFGPEWPRLDRNTGRRLWTGATGLDIDADAPSLLDQVARALEAQLVDGVTAGEVTPATRLLVSGLGALRATLAAFADNSSLSWTEQVLVVADNPCERQLAGLAAVLLGSSSATRMMAPLAETVTAENALDVLRDAGGTNIDRALVSDDATAGPRRLVELLREPLGLGD